MKTPIANLQEIWQNLQPTQPEQIFGISFVVPMFAALGYTTDKLEAAKSIHKSDTSGLIPDFLVFADNEKTVPRLVVEIKRRDETLLNGDFITNCQQSGSLYREAVGYSHSNASNNGIRQYLDIEKVKPERLAPFGLVTNGDFFQIWRRVDGLVMPLTPIEQITAESLPRLMMLLQQILDGIHFPLAVSLWNRKGGTGKTTNTVNIAACLAKAGKRVLLVDLDPQGDCTRNIGLSPDDVPDYLAALVNAIELEDEDKISHVFMSSIVKKTYKTTSGNEYKLAILPCNSESVEKVKAGATIAKGGNNVAGYNIAPMIRDIAGKDYDYVFFDVAPSPDALTQAVLRTTSVYCLPMDGLEAAANAANIFNFVGRARLIKRAEEEKIRHKNGRSTKVSPDGPYAIGAVRSNWSLTIGGMVDKQIQAMFAQNNLSELICGTTIKTSDHVAICSSVKKMPIVCWDNNPSAQLYQALTNELFLKHKFVDG